MGPRGAVVVGRRGPAAIARTGEGEEMGFFNEGALVDGLVVVFWRRVPVDVRSR